MMSKDFDDFVKGLQNQIFEETRAAYAESAGKYASSRPLW